MKADGSQLIPRKHTETLVLLSVPLPCLLDGKPPLIISSTKWC